MSRIVGFFPSTAKAPLYKLTIQGISGILFFFMALFLIFFSSEA